MERVPKQFPGSTIVCVASGPSLTRQDAERCARVAPVIAVNDGYRLVPNAVALYACDAKWWTWHDEALKTFHGAKWSLQTSNWGRVRARFPDVRLLRNTGTQGIETDPAGLRTGHNSGYQAINLAVHYGATRIVLLGYDMQTLNGRTHFFGDHPQRQDSPYEMFRRAFASAVDDLKALGVTVLNCSRTSALTCFPRVPLESVLEPLEEACA